MQIRNCRKLMPDICNSMSDCTPPKDYCCECSHAQYRVELLVNHRTNRFEFNPQFGPIFMSSKWEPLKRQPTDKNPVWDAFEKWYDEKFAPLKAQFDKDV